MHLTDYLRTSAEPIPQWLDEFENGEMFDRGLFFGSRVVYYPGSGTDGQPVKLFGSSHSAHCFVYADYGIAQSALEAELARPTRHFRGYHTLARIQLNESDLVHRGWEPHVDPNDEAPDRYRHCHIIPFGFLEVLERDHSLDDNHGARRLAILFLGSDGIAAYDALFCQQGDTSPPFAVVLQDHGFGGNHDKFGQGGLLERIANRCNVIPQCLLVAEGTMPWDGFVRAPDVDADAGGMHATLRFLYERCD